MSAPITHAEVARQMQLVVDCSVLAAALRNGEIDNYPEIEAGLLSVAKGTIDLLLKQDLLTDVDAEKARKLARSANARVASMTKESGT